MIFDPMYFVLIIPGLLLTLWAQSRVRGSSAKFSKVRNAVNMTGEQLGRRVLVYGNGISGLEIASDLARITDVVSAFRKPRYVIRKVVDGVPSDWQWYTLFGAIERRTVPPDEWGKRQRERILRL